MLVEAFVAFFKYKAVYSIIIVACWDSYQQINFNRKLSDGGFRSTFVCDSSKLDNTHPYGKQGVLYFMEDDNLLTQIKAETFSKRYLWLIVGDEIPSTLNRVRYDAEMVLLRVNIANQSYDTRLTTQIQANEFGLVDVLFHPLDGVLTNPWAIWSQRQGLDVTHERERIIRRQDLMGYPLTIAAPVGTYSEDWYKGSYADYIVDETFTELDSGIRCAYAASALIVERVNATNVLTTTELWSSTTSNNSMSVMLAHGEADLSGAVLRILPARLDALDFIMPIWPFHVGFTYLAERESSTNMFVEPFTPGVWWSCLVTALVLVAAQRATATTPEEKNGAYCAVIATFLQQDASAVPQGFSGRWTFLVLSVCAMLVHAYYTSAIVSALMSAGSGGPDSLRALADSRYSIASEDYDYMRYLFFDVQTKWEDLEYLKRKKKTSNFYFDMHHGAELIQSGNTAFHTEYNQLYPHIKSFTDNQICRLQHVDTVPEVMAWITAAPNGHFRDVFRASGSWLNEVGLSKRVRNQLHAMRPACRAQMLAERVKLGDILPLLGVTALGAFLSVVLLALEILVARWKKEKTRPHEQTFGDVDWKY